MFLPQVGRVSARYDSCVGIIATAIDGDADGMTLLDLETPANTVAEIELPSRAGWRLDGITLADHPAIAGLHEANGTIRFETGAGRYRFVAAAD